MRTIGVLGGMGPAATILFMQRMLAAVPARDDAGHVPLLVDSNTQVPSRIAALVEGTGPSPAPVLRQMARRLEAAGAAALAMPCNTAHRYATEIRDAVAIPFLDMVELSAGHVAERVGSGTRIGLLGSPALRHARVFEGAFEEHGLSAVHPEDAQAMIGAIREIKSSGATDAARAALRAAADDLLARGADYLVIACTEFSLLEGSLPPDWPVVDSLDLLVAACVAEARRDPPAK